MIRFSQTRSRRLREGPGLTLLLAQPVVELCADRLALVVQVVDVPRAGVSDAHDRPQALRLALPLVRLGLGCGP